jgi:hypothetical protein
VDELRLLLLDVNQPLSEAELARLMERMDTNHDGNIDFDEFAASMLDLMTGRGVFAAPLPPAPAARPSTIQTAAVEPLKKGDGSTAHSEHGGSDDDDDDDDEEEDMPEEFKPLTVEQQQSAIKV